MKNGNVLSEFKKHVSGVFSGQKLTLFFFFVITFLENELLCWANASSIAVLQWDSVERRINYNQNENGYLEIIWNAKEDLKKLLS